MAVRLQSNFGSGLREECTCSVCLDMFITPCTLPCGHSFCRSCIETHWRVNCARGGCDCPQCRHVFHKRPALQTSTPLASIIAQLGQRCPFRAADALAFISADPARSSPPALSSLCGLCTMSRVPAAKACLTCEVSFCGEHLRMHDETAAFTRQHRLLELPAAVACGGGGGGGGGGDARGALGVCGRHGRPLEFFCRSDLACVCAACVNDGLCQGHAVEELQLAVGGAQMDLKQKRQKLKIKQMTVSKSKIEYEIATKDIMGSCVSLKLEVVDRFGRARRALDERERAAVITIEMEQSRLLALANDRLAQLEQQLVALREAEEQLNAQAAMGDALAFMQGYSSASKRAEALVGLPMDEGPTLQVETPAVTSIKAWLERLIRTLDGSKDANANLKLMYGQLVTLDPDTASTSLLLSQDGRMAATSSRRLSYPERPERFDHWCQVMCHQAFASGQRYWAATVSGGDTWRIGVAYGSMGRKGSSGSSLLGLNGASWCLAQAQCECAAWHDEKHESVVVAEPPRTVGVFLDYGAGVVTFIDADRMAELYTFRAKFTQPLYPAFQLGGKTTLVICP
ncbi:tripartite motif-containing protein 14-like [Petromyzon marinus]|uniref:tripartite motif-containing protein 14-like n=1 Tax=Petromyzon marinus TaxID=7757 RepID=UPI003F71C5D6